MGLVDMRNDSAKVRALLPEIESELKAGVTRTEIFDALKDKHGLSLTFAGFLSALKRARRKTRKADSGKMEPGGNDRPEPEERKTGIIGTKDFQPSADIDEKITQLTGKNRKY